VLADAEEMDAEVVGQDRLVDDVTNDLRVREGPTTDPLGDVAEGVQP